KDPTPKELEKYHPSLFFTDQGESSIRPYVDIYSLPVLAPKPSGINKIKRVSEITDNEALDPDSITLVDDTHSLPEDLLQHIASGATVVFWSEKPSWAPTEVSVFSSEKDLDAFVQSMRETPFFAERYGIACRRSAILNNNVTRSVYELLTTLEVPCEV